MCDRVPTVVRCLVVVVVSGYDRRGCCDTDAAKRQGERRVRKSKNGWKTKILLFFFFSPFFLFNILFSLSLPPSLLHERSLPLAPCCLRVLPCVYARCSCCSHEPSPLTGWSTTAAAAGSSWRLFVKKL